LQRRGVLAEPATVFTHHLELLLLGEDPLHLPYHIIWYPDTREHFRYLTARQRSIVFDSVEEQLVNEPTAETRNRKEMRPNSLASWELRIGDLRVYYDVTEESQTVTVIAVGIKRGNRVFIGGEERQL